MHAIIAKMSSIEPSAGQEPSAHNEFSALKESELSVPAEFSPLQASAEPAQETLATGVDQPQTNAENQILEIEQDALEETTWTDEGRPSWANEQFEALLFTVGGMRLAAPLVELGGIVRLDKEITPIFSQPDWFLGLHRWNGRNIRVVDTAELVKPERELPPQEHGEFKFVVLIQGTEWGLAIHDVQEAIRINPKDIKWRNINGKQPWLAGTVVEQMCAILDVNALAHRLYNEQKDKK